MKIYALLDEDQTIALFFEAGDYRFSEYMHEAVVRLTASIASGSDGVKPPKFHARDKQVRVRNTVVYEAHLCEWDDLRDALGRPHNHELEILLTAQELSKMGFPHYDIQYGEDAWGCALRLRIKQSTYTAVVDSKPDLCAYENMFTCELFVKLKNHFGANIPWDRIKLIYNTGNSE